jgi:hypothetical protein
MGIFADTQSALETKLATLSPSVPTVPTNIRHTPTLATSYINSTIRYAETIGATLLGNDIYPGFFQIDVFTQLEKGSGANLTIQDNLRTLFNNITLTKNTTNVRIEKVSLGPLGAEEAWLHGIINIHFTAYNF